MSELVDILDQSGNYTGEIAERKVAHAEGLWHKGVVLFILSSDNSKILLQKRANIPGKPWPGFWDVSVGGHVDAGEFGYQAIVREAKEELGLDFDPHDLLFIGATTSDLAESGRHFNEYYVVNRDLDPSTLRFQETEVETAQWFTIDELAEKMKTYSDLTNKRGCWDYALRYLESLK